MTSTEARIRYGRGTQIVHWLTAAVVLAAFIVSSGGPESRVYSPERAGQLLVHESLGTAVLVLAALGIACRILERPPNAAQMAPWMRASSRIVQIVLAVLVLATPVTAVLGAWLAGHPLTIALIGSVGPFLPTAHALGRWLAELHSWLGDALIWLAGMHAAAALLHHFVLKDRVLLSMLPWGMR